MKRVSFKRLRRRALRIAAVVIVVLGVLEIVLRIAGSHYQNRFWEASTIAPGDIAILTLGESTTGGLWLPIEDSYPKQLQVVLQDRYRTSRIQVVIPPHSGQNTSQMLHRLPRYLAAFHPVLVILMAGVNNEWSLAESNLGQFMPSGSWRTYAFRLRRRLDDIKVVRLGRWLYDSSGQAWSNLKSDLEGQPRRNEWPPDNDPLVAHIGPDTFARLWQSDMGQMIAQSKASGAAVLLMTYPNYERPSVAQFREMADKWEVPLLDNHPAFEEFIRQGREKEVLFDDLRHPNKKGYAMVADNAFRKILEMGVLDSQAGESGEGRELGKGESR